MKKVKMSSFRNELMLATPIAMTQSGMILKLRDGNILKIFNPTILEASELIGYSIESKILDAVPIKDSPEILVPTNAIYDDYGTFCGYTMPCANGIDYNTYDNILSISDREDLNRYAIEHSKLENILIKNENIVFPDFCTCDNIFIDNNGNFQFIDYDGLQIGNHKSYSVSTSLGDHIDHSEIRKYCDEDGKYTKELDKKSSIILYFLSTFNINLSKVNTINPATGKVVTLDIFLNCINLDDPDVCHKVWKLFQDNQPNEYLGDDVFKIAEKYDMKVVAKAGECYVKQLQKKK